MAEQIATMAWKLKNRGGAVAGKCHRLEDLAVVGESLVRTTKKGERREYLKWICYWREGGRVTKTYLGSCTKMDRHQALEKARDLKAKALGLYLITKPPVFVTGLEANTCRKPIKKTNPYAQRARNVIF